MIILGIDPGTARVGYGVVKKTPKLLWVAHGTIDTPKNSPTTDRLLLLEQGLSQLFRKYKPDVMAVESLFFFKNLKTVMPVSEAKGVILLAGAKKNVPTHEFSPLQVKMAITGYGRAEKKQIQRMVKEILQLSELPRPDDAADALGIAITCSFVLPNDVLAVKTRQRGRVRKKGPAHIATRSVAGGGVNPSLSPEAQRKGGVDKAFKKE